VHQLLAVTTADGRTLRVHEDGDPDGVPMLALFGTPNSSLHSNDFAAQLLMPATWIPAQAKKLDDTEQLAAASQVGEQAMNHRLVNLGLR